MFHTLNISNFLRFPLKYFLSHSFTHHPFRNHLQGFQLSRTVPYNPPIFCVWKTTTSKVKWSLLSAWAVTGPSGSGSIVLWVPGWPNTGKHLAEYQKLEFSLKVKLFKQICTSTSLNLLWVDYGQCLRCLQGIFAIVGCYILGIISETLIFLSNHTFFGPNFKHVFLAKWQFFKSFCSAFPRSFQYRFV